MMECELYWEVVCRYGHVGRGNEINVSRHLRTEKHCNLMDVIRIVSEMPGVKKGNTILHSIVKANPISKKQYELGKKKENEDFYLQKLMSYKQGNIQKIA